MADLIIRFAKYQINFNISQTMFENFIKFKQVWPQLQPPRQLEVKLKIYTQSHMDSPDLIPVIWDFGIKVTGF